MKLLKLPSGEHLNGDLICHWGELTESEHVWNKTTLKVSPGVFLSVTFSGNVEVEYNHADARALYAWLEANATAIGEDGREAAKAPDLIDTYIPFLKALEPLWPQGLSDLIAWDDFGLSIDDLGMLVEDGYILPSSQGYLIRELGISAIEGK